MDVEGEKKNAEKYLRNLKHKAYIYIFSFYNFYKGNNGTKMKSTGRSQGFFIFLRFLVF